MFGCICWLQQVLCLAVHGRYWCSWFACCLSAHPNSTPVSITQVCSLVGGLLNVLRIPERWLQPKDPGCAAPLDYLLNSHQIMHLLVAVAMWQLHLGATADYHTVSALLAGTEQCP